MLVSCNTPTRHICVRARPITASSWIAGSPKTAEPDFLVMEGAEHDSKVLENSTSSPSRPGSALPQPLRSNSKPLRLKLGWSWSRQPPAHQTPAQHLSSPGIPDFPIYFLSRTSVFTHQASPQSSCTGVVLFSTPHLRNSQALPKTARLLDEGLYLTPFLSRFLSTSLKLSTAPTLNPNPEPLASPFLVQARSHHQQHQQYCVHQLAP